MLCLFDVLIFDGGLLTNLRKLVLLTNSRAAPQQPRPPSLAAMEYTTVHQYSRLHAHGEGTIFLRADAGHHLFLAAMGMVAVYRVARPRDASHRAELGGLVLVPRHAGAARVPPPRVVVPMAPRVCLSSTHSSTPCSATTRA